MQRIDITQMKDGSFLCPPQITIDGSALLLSDSMCIEIIKAIEGTNAYQMAKKTADDYKILINEK